MLGVAAVATLMLSSCVGIGQDEGGDSAAGEDGEDWSMFYQDFVDLNEDGGWVEFDDQLELGSPEVYYEDLYDSDLDQEAAFVYGMVTEPEATVHEPDGSESGVNSVTDEPVVYLYLYNDDAGHWQLYDLVFHTLDDIQDELGEPGLTG